MKKFLTLIVALLMVVSFTGCSNDTPTNETSEETVSNKTENNVEDSVNSDSDSDLTTEDTEETETPADKTDDNTAEDAKKPVKPQTPEKPDKSEEEADKETSNSDQVADSNESKSLGNKLLSEFKAIAGNGNALTVAEKLSAYSDLSVLSMGAMEVEPGLLTGFDNAEINGFKEGAMFAPMMGTIPFVGYVFTLEDGTDTSSFISTLTSNANRRWNICTEAEETVTGSAGNKVFFVMCNKSLED